jgi:hypothetical protein
VFTFAPNSHLFWQRPVIFYWPGSAVVLDVPNSPFAIKQSVLVACIIADCELLQPHA